jgi:hypothetical protein
LCENLDTLDEPEVRNFKKWLSGLFVCLFKGKTFSLVGFFVLPL